MSDALSKERFLVLLQEMAGCAATGRNIISLQADLLNHDAALRQRIEDMRRIIVTLIVGDYSANERDEWMREFRP